MNEKEVIFICGYTYTTEKTLAFQKIGKKRFAVAFYGNHLNHQQNINKMQKI